MMPIIPPLNETHLALKRRYSVRPAHRPPVRLPKAAKPPDGLMAPPVTVTERLAGKDKLTPKESAAWLDDWLTRINSTP